MTVLHCTFLTVMDTLKEVKRIYLVFGIHKQTGTSKQITLTFKHPCFELLSLFIF